MTLSKAETRTPPKLCDSSYKISDKSHKSRRKERCAVNCMLRSGTCKIGRANGDYHKINLRHLPTDINVLIHFLVGVISVKSTDLGARPLAGQRVALCQGISHVPPLLTVLAESFRGRASKNPRLEFKKTKKEEEVMMTMIMMIFMCILSIKT